MIPTLLILRYVVAVSKMLFGVPRAVRNGPASIKERRPMSKGRTNMM